ncbi:hypothetical protein QJQ45_005521 [Haematococcus lacustris]|nr:hypothetical protein QJQ45_005521 [Haematococcus lacustris]
MTSTCGSQQGSQEEPKVPWNDSQDELFAVLYAQAFAEVQGKTNGDKMGELLAAYVNEHSASLGGRKMTPAQALHRAAYAKAGCAAVWKWNLGRRQPLARRTEQQQSNRLVLRECSS